MKFEYGKWTDKYQWRNPGEGFNEDLDSRFESFSKGRKELYYLNAVRTATHTAFFIKELRADGKGATSLHEEAVLTNKSAKEVTYVDEGSFEFHNEVQTLFFLGAELTRLSSDFQRVSFPAATLRLSKIILVQGADISTGAKAAASSAYNHTYDYTIINPQIVQSSNRNGAWLNANFPDNKYISQSYDLHHGENVLDIHDFQQSPIPTDKILREIDFDHDYSLAKGTSNSFDEAGALYECETCEGYVPDNSVTQVKTGKLTLNSLTFKGKGGAGSLPPIRFRYERSNAFVSDATITAVDASHKTIDISVNGSPWQVGDLLKWNQHQGLFYGYITSTAPFRVRLISSELPYIGYISHLTQSKNPPYSKDAFDMWGSYKVDYVDDANRNLSRFPTEISARNADVWSLQEIQSSLGSVISIDYESDSYSKSILSPFLGFSLNYLSQSDPDPSFPPEYQNGYKRVTYFSSIPEGMTFNFNSLGYHVGDGVSISAALYVCEYTGQGAYQCRDEISVSGEVVQVTGKTLKFVTYVHAYSIQGIYGGVLRLRPRDYQPGGGIRVHSIGVSDPLKAETKYTTYTYDFNGKSSGVTSYEPINVGNVKLNSGRPTLDRLYARYMLEPFLTMLSLSREVPPPGVFYGKVKISESIVNAEGAVSEMPAYLVYDFATFDDGMIGSILTTGTSISSSGSHKGEHYDVLASRRITLKNYSQRAGLLKATTLYDRDDNRLTETIVHYLHDEQDGKTFDDNSSQYKPLLARYSHQGLFEETFLSARWIRHRPVVVGIPPPIRHKLLGLTSKKETYPVVQTGTTSVNYKTGITTETSTLGFDFYTGATSLSVSTDGYGNSLLSESSAAYHQYNGMGMLIDGGRNMLSQEGSSYLYKVDPEDHNNKTGLLSASVQTWSKETPVLDKLGVGPVQDPGQYNIWRKKSLYGWEGDDGQALNSDGLYPFAGFEPFNFQGANSAKWQKTAELTLYDTYSHALGSKDINDRHASTKMSYDQTKIFATAANATYEEFAYSGAEENTLSDKTYGGGVKAENGISVSRQSESDVTTTHTGSKALQVSAPMQKAFMYTFTTLPDKDYHASVWVNSNAGRLYYSINGLTTQSPATPVETMKSGSWYQLSLTIPASSQATTVQVWCATIGESCNFDDFRVCPVNAAMLSYVYNEWGELSHILDNNNLFTRYDYDALGRLKSTYRESFGDGTVRTSEQIYHYALQQD